MTPRPAASTQVPSPPGGKLRDLAVAIGAVGFAVVASIIFVDNRVAAQTDAGMKVQSARHEALETRVKTLEQRFDRFEDRTDKQMNAALDALRVPLAARPPPLPLDGGAR